MLGTQFMAIGVFIFIMAVYLIFVMLKKSNKNMTDKLLDKKFEEDNFENETQLKAAEPKDFMSKLGRELMEARIAMDPKVFVMVIIVASILLFLGAYYLLGQPLVALAPLPFTFYILPNGYIDYRKQKNMDRFDSELIQVLRRMSSVLKNGSVLQALEDVKDLPSLSEKTRILFNEVYHRYKYGDSIESAFYKVAEKSGSKQFELVAISIDINKELGADLSSSINEIALNIQRLRLSEKEYKSLTAQTLMIGRVLSVVPFFIIGFMVTQNKEYFDSYLETIGHQLIFMLLFMMMFFGIYVVEKFAKKK